MEHASVVFLTLFLNLTTGVHPVEVTVGGPVASVEIMLDGTLQGVLHGEPWRLECDLGAELQPRKLEAKAFDHDHRLVARAVQRINYPRGLAEASFFFEPGKNGLPRWVRLLWSNAYSEAPQSISLTLDGQQLVVVEPTRFELPKYQPSEIHLLGAELQFPHQIVARATATFGGPFGGEAQTDLTALPILNTGKKRHRPTVESLQGRLLCQGEPVMVTAVEQSHAEIYVVQDQGSLTTIPRRRVGSRNMRVFSPGSFHRDDKLRLVEPHLHEEMLPRAIFPISPTVRLSRNVLSTLLTAHRYLPQEGNRQRLADAVALAGLRAAATGKPRAVLLILGDQPEDTSVLEPAMVRSYLQSLQVPLFVWSTASTNDPAGWGDARYIPTLSKFHRAIRGLSDALKSQLIVWIEGSPFLHEIELTAAPGSPILMSGAEQHDV